jgi:Protein of unknown function (DUF3105)
LTTSPRRPSPASRAVRRSRRPAPRKVSFVERNRNVLLWGGGILAFGVLIFVGLVLPGLQPAYQCVNLFDPTPAPSFVAPTQAAAASGATAAPAATAPPAGYVQPDMGRSHVDPGTVVKYTWCPPASGNHYNASGQGPIRAGFYDQNTGTIPEGWIHNLEHGAIVLLYKCPGPGCEGAGQSEMQSLLARWPASPICHLPAGGTVTPIITRFDNMPYNFAAVVWDMVLPMDSLDENALFAFYAAYGEQFNPEKQCASPTSSPPAPAASSAATSAPSAGPSGAPASGESAAPAGS